MITGEISNKIAVHNIAGGITGPDARVKSIAAQIMERRPTTLFMPEAYDLDKPGAQTRVENFAGEMSNIYFVGYKEYDGKSGGYMALVRKDRAVQPEQQLEFGKEQLVNGNSYYFKMLSFAGRGAVEMSFHDPKSERLVAEVGLHANTLEQERGQEVTEFLAQYQGAIERGLPLVLAGDLNTVGEKNLKTWAYRLLGGTTEVVYNAAVKASGAFGLELPPQDYRSTFLPARLASIPIRVGQYAEGREYEQLVNAGFTDIAPEGPTTSFPGMRASEFVLRLSGVQADHIMCAPPSEFTITSQQKYAQQTGDDHNWVETGFYLRSGNAAIVS